MFPVSDFNFVVAGIATFAATVGYACSRRLSTSLPNSDLIRESMANDTKLREKTPTQSTSSDKLAPIAESAMLVEAPEVAKSSDTNIIAAAATSIPRRKESLKRKVPHDGFDEPQKEELGYPHNLANLYPNKRSRTPSAESETPSPNITPAASLESIISRTEDVDVEIPFVSSDPPSIVATPAAEPPRTPSPGPEVASPREPSPTPLPSSPAPPPMSVSTPLPTTSQPTPPRDVTPRPSTPNPFSSSVSGGFAAFANHDILPRPSTPKAFMSPSSGFAAFAGSTSPFASLSKPPQTAFGKNTQRSIWSTGDLTTHQNETDSPGIFLAEVLKPAENHALEEAKVTPSHPTEKYTHLTGEEDEDVEMEQKGVKLFVKRGNNPFSEGIFGHIKLLSNRETLEERILFRRVPLWKVSMNVRVQPTVRATFVPEENVLRFILKETVETSATGSKQEVVIYALKPGRSCSKEDFKDFAEGLLKSSHFKSATSKTRSA